MIHVEVPERVIIALKVDFLMGRQYENLKGFVVKCAYCGATVKELPHGPELQIPHDDSEGPCVTGILEEFLVANPGIPEHFPEELHA